MILPTLSIPQHITDANSEISNWVKKTRDEVFVSIGVVGEDVHVLPGFLESIEVASSLLVDDVKLEGMSGTIKVIHGWTDCDLSITLTLVDVPRIDMTTYTVRPNVSRFDCLAEIVGWFKKMKDGKPQIFTIHHPHVAAWGARAFVFSDLKSSQSRTRSAITCVLEFDEYDSTTGKSQERQIGINIAQASEAVEAQNPPVDDGTRRGLGKLEAQYAKF